VPSGKSSPHAAPAPHEAAAEDAGPPTIQADAVSDHAEHEATRSSPKVSPEPPHPEATERAAPAPKKVEPRPAPTAHAIAHTALVAPPEISELLSQGRAVRVLVKRSARDESLYIVRPHATAHVPVGAREAFLVLGEADPDFLAGATR
jgi:hypothetical protein